MHKTELCYLISLNIYKYNLILSAFNRKNSFVIVIKLFNMTDLAFNFLHLNLCMIDLAFSSSLNLNV